MADRGLRSRDIRAREVRRAAIDPESVRMQQVEYETGIGREVFFQFTADAVETESDRGSDSRSDSRSDSGSDGGEERLLGFCRLSLPDAEVRNEILIDEIRDSAMIREVHVYGAVVGFGEDADQRRSQRSQHLGLGTRLVEAAAARSRAEGFDDLAVISAIGTRDYYRGLGFEDGGLYQYRKLQGGPA